MIPGTGPVADKTRPMGRICATHEYDSWNREKATADMALGSDGQMDGQTERVKPIHPHTATSLFFRGYEYNFHCELHGKIKSNFENNHPFLWRFISGFGVKKCYAAGVNKCAHSTLMFRMWQHLFNKISFLILLTCDTFHCLDRNYLYAKKAMTSHQSQTYPSDLLLILN